MNGRTDIVNAKSRYSWTFASSIADSEEFRSYYTEGREMPRWEWWVGQSPHGLEK